MVRHPHVKSTKSGSRYIVILYYGLFALILLPVSGSPLNTPAVAQKEKKKEPRVSTMAANQPKIKHAKIIAVSGIDSSLRGYFFENKQAAESFAQAIAVFKIATRFQLVVSTTQTSVFDMDRKKMVMPPSWADQFEINSSKVILLEGTHKQHARVEKIMQVLGAE